MNAALILTPSDMRPFIGGHDHSVSHLVAGRNEFEPAIRHAVDAIFRDMQLISSDEAVLVSSYLDGIEEPLHELAHYGVSLFAIRIQGTLKVKEGSAIPNWTRTHFLVVPTTGYFRIEGEDTRFHRFDPECATAISNLYASIRSGKNLTVRFDAKSLREEYENDVPWCEQCCLSESLAIAGTTISVQAPNLRTSCKIVERAIADAEALLKTGGPTSAVDRVHTALHGYLRNVCGQAHIGIGKDLDIAELFSQLRQNHPKFKNLGDHPEPVLKVLRCLGKVVDALNQARNRGSMAHPNEALLDVPEARLFINAARTLLHYLDDKISDESGT